MRELVLRAFAAAIERVNGRDAVRRALAEADRRGPLHLIAVGKAAAAMTEGAIDVLGEVLVEGLVVTKHGHLDGLSDRRLRLLEADHPVPGEASLAAGAALVDYFSGLPARERLLVLISGGASSLVEVLPQGFGLADLQALTGLLLASGMDIHGINRIRKEMSRIKGGKLLQFGRISDIEALLISDVRGDDPAMIGSGLFWPENDDQLVVWPKAAQPFRARLPAPVCFNGREPPLHRIVACLDDAKQAAAAAVRDAGQSVFVHDRFLEGNVDEVAGSLAGFLMSAPPGIHIWGGETTVMLPSRPGRGGRNQHLALLLARLLVGNDRIVVLCAGTDGTDGPTDDAGAIIDGDTIERGEKAGHDADTAVMAFDAGTFLEASGDLVTTGPTGTNVMDLVIASVGPLRDHSSTL